VSASITAMVFHLHKHRVTSPGSVPSPAGLTDGHIFSFRGELNA
jgi:hypothetical protein